MKKTRLLRNILMVIICFSLIIPTNINVSAGTGTNSFSMDSITYKDSCFYANFYPYQGATKYVLKVKNLSTKKIVATKQVSSSGIKAGQLAKIKMSYPSKTRGAGYSVYVVAYKGKKTFTSNSKNFAKPFSKVTNLTAKASGETTIKLSWSATSKATGYIVMTSTEKDGKYTTLEKVTSTSYTHKNVPIGKTQYYKVLAYNKYTKGLSSTIVSAQTKVSPVTSINMTQLSNTKICLSWDKQSKADGYCIYRYVTTSKAGEGTYVKIATVKKTAYPTYIDSDVQNGNYYHYKIVCYVNNGEKNVYSTGKTDVVPAAKKSVVSSKLIGHRGTMITVPENTAPAFITAGEAGAYGIESDLKSTKDGVLVCSHTDTLSEFTDGDGLVGKKTWAEISKFTVNTGANIEQYPDLKMAKFEEYLDICKQYNCVAFIDLKYSSVATVKSCVALVKKKGMMNQVIFQSSVLDYLKAVKSTASDAKMCYLVNEITDAKINTAKSYGCTIINPHVLSPGVIAKARANGLEVACWECDSSSLAKRYQCWGVKYIMVDDIVNISIESY